MRSTLLLLGMVAFLRCLSGQQPAPVRTAALAGGSIAGPAAGGIVVPAAQKLVMGNTSTGVPLSSTPTRYQQVFLRQELPPTVYSIRCIAFRPDAADLTGRTIDVEMTLGHTTYDHKTITATFASNLNTGTPVNVITRKMIRLPDLLPGTVQPNMFMLQFATDVPYAWVPAGNLILDITVWGNDNNNNSFLYPLDAEASPGATTSRVMSFGSATAPTGKVIAESGLVVCFSDRCTTSAYSSYGKGCPGTGNSGLVVPPQARTQWLNSSSQNPIWFDERWQQEIDAAALPAAPTLLSSMAFRADDRGARTAPITMTYKVSVGLTSTTSASMTTTFATNITDPMTIVFQGNVVFPATEGRNSDLGRFDYAIPFTAPFFYTPTTGKNLLIDVENATNPVFPLNRTIDLEFSAAAQGANVYGFPRTSPTGYLSVACPAIRFGIRTLGTSTPVLSALGPPAINSTFEIALRDARPASAAVLAFGGSDKTWGPFTLPLDLTPLGAPGCSLLASFDLGVPLAISAAGDARFPVPLPNDSSLIGLRLYSQFVVADPQVNRLGAAFSNGGAALLGEF